MARLEGPLFSLEARNTLAGRLEYSQRHGKSFVRNHQQPTGDASADQIVIRGYFDDGAAAWQSLSSGEKGQWHTFNNS